MDGNDKFWSILYVCAATVFCVAVVGQVGLLLAIIGIPAIALAKVK